MVSNRAKWLSGGAFAAMVIAGATGFIAQNESGNTPRLTAYQDIVGVWTICDGRTQGVRPGMTQTVDQCQAWLRTQVGADYATVERCIKPELTLGQAIAFTDAVHNLGPAVVCGSTLQAKANGGDVEGACMQLVDAKGSDGLPTGWTKAGGKFSPGLLNRRELATVLCIRGLQ